MLSGDHYEVTHLGIREEFIFMFTLKYSKNQFFFYVRDIKFKNNSTIKKKIEKKSLSYVHGHLHLLSFLINVYFLSIQNSVAYNIIKQII